MRSKESITKNVVLAAVEQAGEISPDDLSRALRILKFDEKGVRAVVRDLIDDGKLVVNLNWNLVRGKSDEDDGR